jgi:hypothetical protein
VINSSTLSKFSRPKSLMLDIRVVLSILTFVSGFLAVQRFAIPPWNTYICLLPFFVFLYGAVIKNSTMSITSILLALTLSVDNGGGAYGETPTTIRYIIYVSILYTLLCFSQPNIKRAALILVCSLIVGVLLGMFSNILRMDPVFSLDSLRRDVQVLVVLVILLLGRRHALMDLSIVFYGGLGYLVGEITNIAFFYELGRDYLSYDSLKVFIFFPLIYAMLTGKSRVLVLFLAILTLVIVFNYGARMILVSSFFLFLLAYLTNYFHCRVRDVFVLLAFVTMLFLLANSEHLAANEWLMSMKPSAFIVAAVNMSYTMGFMELVEIMDPIRFGEHVIFFDRPFIEIVFGSGLGSGIYDGKGVLDFVTYDQTAFSEGEILSSSYFNFHDFWIDFGLRFGLLPVFILLYIVTFDAMKKIHPFFGVFLGLLLINTTFSMSGVLLTAFFYRFWPRELCGTNAEPNAGECPAIINSDTHNSSQCISFES